MFTQRSVRRVFTALCAMGLVVPLLAIAQTPESLPLEKVLRREVLPNGLTVIVVENHSVNLATAHLVFHGGAMTQTPDLQGVPHLFEHMLFRSYRDADDAGFDLASSRTKASYNGGTGDEEVSYTLWFPADHLGENVQLMADLVREPIFRDKDLQPERFVVRNEMQRAQSQPSFLLSEAATRGLWGQWFPRKNTIGNDLSLFTATVPQLKTLYETWYVPNNAALIITGDVKPDDVLGSVRKHFGRWKRRDDPLAANPVPPPPPLDSSIAFVYTHEVQGVTVRMSWRAPTLTQDPTGVLDADALTDLLNAEEGSMQRSLVDGGAFQSARFSSAINRYGSELRFTGTTTTEHLTGALGFLGTQLGALADTFYFDATQLKAAAKRREVQRVLEMEESASFASTVGSFWALAGIDYLLSYNTAVNARSKESIAAFAQKYIIGKPYVVGALTPAGTEQQVGTSVAQFIAFMKQ
jgi:zinc protease